MALRRTLGTTDLTLLVIGNVIGSGIFLVPGAVLRDSGGSVGIASAIWVVGGLLSLMGALSYGELASMQGPEGGGLYGFIRDAFGGFVAFLYGWTLFFVIGAGTIATLAVAAANYMGQFTEPGFVLTDTIKKVIAVTMLAVIMVVTVRGTRQSASVQNAATAVKVLAIVLMSGLLFVLGGSSEPAQVTAAPGNVSLSGVGLGLVSVLWAYEGWQYVTFVQGEALDPQRMLPRAIAVGTLTLVALYLLANFAYLSALGASGVAASNTVAADAITAAAGPAAGKLLALAIIISMYSAALATVITVPRVYYSMAREGLFFPKLAEVHERFGTPAAAIIGSCVWAMVLAASGTFEQLLTYVVFVGWIFYALGAAAVIVLRRRLPDAPRSFRVPGYPITPALFVVAAAAIVGNTIWSKPGQAVIGLLPVAFGVPAFYFWRRTAGSGR